MVLHEKYNKNNIESQLKSAIFELVEEYIYSSEIKKFNPKVASTVYDYLLKGGKKIRPHLFIYSYFAGNNSAPDYLFHSAASLELLHQFALIHDDIIDNSSTRRNNPSLHMLMQDLFDIKILDSQNLAIIIGDTLYSYALSSFLKVKVDNEKKYRAFNSILNTASHTGKGQFQELLYSTKPIEQSSFDEIITIYDNKTSSYTFSGPLIAGAQLAGSTEDITCKLLLAGNLLGRAYQIMDDLTECIDYLDKKLLPLDFLTNRKTILFWHLYNYSSYDTQQTLKNIQKNNYRDLYPDDLKWMLEQTSTYDYLQNQIDKNFNNAISLLSNNRNFIFKDEFHQFLINLFSPNLIFTDEIL